MDDAAEARLTLKRDFAGFLDSDGGHGEYATKLAALLSAPGGVPARGARLDVDLQARRMQHLWALGGAAGDGRGGAAAGCDCRPLGGRSAVGGRPAQRW